MAALIAAATRSGRLDAKTAAALLEHPHLRLLAAGDAPIAPAFAREAADALLDPHRLTRADPLVPGPAGDDVEAARALMERSGVGPGADPERLIALAGNVHLPARLVADVMRLAVLSETNRSGAEATFGAVLRNLGSCSKESKRVLAEGLVAHIDAVADTLDAGSGGQHERTNTREGIHTLMGDGQARETLVAGAAALAGDRFGAAAREVATALAAHGGVVDDGFGNVDRDALKEAGGLLRILAEWPGEDASEVPGLLAHGFGLFLAGAGTVATGGGLGIALAGVGAAGGEVFDAADADAQGAVEHRRRVHVDDLRDVTQHVAVTSLLLTPTDPPLWDLLVDTPPTRGRDGDLVSPDGTFVIPEPGTPAWVQFHRWMETNPKLANAVEILVERSEPGIFG